MLQIKNTLGGGKPEGLYVWKKYEYVETPNPYLSFIGNEDFTLKTKNTTANWNGTLEYSTDTTTWKTWNGSEISSSGNNLYLRGTGNTVIDSTFEFTGTSALKIACEGNIENLLDYNIVSSGNHLTMADYCYANMFEGCTALTAAPELPATILATSCYSRMFKGCTSLTKAPELPATTLATSCYAFMFQGCTSLTLVPLLPGIALANSCYDSMFYGCTNLITAPELPATTLADYCYASMFGVCTSLTIVPELPATTLANSCYLNMFLGCSNIKLSTTQTGEYQTAYRIPTSGTGTTASNAFKNMFTNTGGTFKGTPEINTTYYLSTSNTVV